MGGEKEWEVEMQKPSFLVKERERDVFLNGEMKYVSKVTIGRKEPIQVKKAVVCLKVLQVDGQ